MGPKCLAFSTPDASALILNLLAKRTGQPLINAMTIVWIYIISRKTLNYINGNISQQKNIYKCKYHNLLSGQICFVGTRIFSGPTTMLGSRVENPLQ